ncbi:MAG TPA: hypothetical protein ENG60_01145, partial [Thermoplasmatales archaeon]|nr:hypothetical protein [Thermoplasmatales archaeon]HEX17009.1 hypothetical protein [Thermoplasmatales archaeon]
VKNLLYRGKHMESIGFAIYNVGLGMIKLFAPFFPHITEEIYHRYYKDKEGKESIHVSDWPEEILIDELAEKNGEFIKEIISAIRRWKGERGIALNAPMEKVMIFSDKTKLIEDCREDIVSTLNIGELIISGEIERIEKRAIKVKPRFASIGRRYREKARDLYKMIEREDPERLYREMVNKGVIKLNGFELTFDDLDFEFSHSVKGEDVDIVEVNGSIIAIPVAR